MFTAFLPSAESLVTDLVEDKAGAAQLSAWDRRYPSRRSRISCVVTTSRTWVRRFRDLPRDHRLRKNRCLASGPCSRTATFSGLAGRLRTGRIDTALVPGLPAGTVTRACRAAGSTRRASRPRPHDDRDRLPRAERYSRPTKRTSPRTA